MIEIQAEAARLRKMIDDEVHRIALAARSEYESARANEAALAANLETLKDNAVTTNEAMVTLRELERDVQASRAVYEAFLVRARETGEQERLDTKNIRVISRADPPQRRSFPPSNMLLAVGALLLGVGAGTGIAIMRDTYGKEALPRAGGSSVVRRKLAQRRQGTLADRRVAILYSGACGVAERRHLVRVKRRGGSEFAFCDGNPQSTRRGAGEPQNPRQSDDSCRRFR